MTTPRRDLVREAARRSGAEQPSRRGELRKLIGTLTQHKLSAKQAMRTRQWASHVTRTEDELSAKVAELQKLGDIR